LTEIKDEYEKNEKLMAKNQDKSVLEKNKTLVTKFENLKDQYVEELEKKDVKKGYRTYKLATVTFKTMKALEIVKNAY
jgi:hypothetical protein